MSRRASALWSLALLAGCGASSSAPRRASPSEPAAYEGHLARGMLVRAIVESDGGKTLKVVRRLRRGESEADFITIENAPHFVPAEGGTMVVLRVLGSSMFHTPDDASGAHYWFDEWSCDLVRVEMSEREAIGIARGCVAESAHATDFELDTPFAQGPSARGRWVVHFRGRIPIRAEGIRIEIDEALRCQIRP